MTISVHVLEMSPHLSQTLVPDAVQAAGEPWQGMDSPGRCGGARAGNVCSEGRLGVAIHVSKFCSSSTDVI